MKTYAGFWKRMGAFILDYIIILGYLLGLALLSILATSLFGANQWLFADRIRLWRSLGRTLLKFVPWEISHTLIWQIYFSPQTESVWINYGFVLVYLLIGLNIVSLEVSKTHQTLCDLLTNTYVVSSH